MLGRHHSAIYANRCSFSIIHGRKIKQWLKMYHAACSGSNIYFHFFHNVRIVINHKWHEQCHLINSLKKLKVKHFERSNILSFSNYLPCNQMYLDILYLLIIRHFHEFFAIQSIGYHFANFRSCISAYKTSLYFLYEIFNTFQESMS